MAPINLLRGWPSPALLPTTALLAATNSVLSNVPLVTPGLLYGPDEGHLPLRQSLATWLTRFYRDTTDRWCRILPPSSGRSHLSQNEARQTFPELNPPTGGEDRISITGGASQNLGVTLAALTDPHYTRRIWIVAPGYFMGFKIFEDAGFAGRLRAVPEIEAGPNAGPDVEWLRREIKRVDDEEEANKSKRDDSVKPKEKYPKLYRHVIYTVPCFANPSSLTTTLATREALVRCAREFDALIICDDVYDMLFWPADPENTTNPTTEAENFKAFLPRIVDVDRYLDGGAASHAHGYGNVVSNGSFSKICAPGVRCGWVEGEPSLAFAVSQAGTTKSGGAPSQLTSLFLHHLLTTPSPSSPSTDTLTHHITHTLHPAYRTRHTLLLNAITTHLTPHGITLPQPDRSYCGGYFAWLTLPAPLTGAGVADRALEDEALVVARGELFEVPGEEEGKLGGVRFPRNLRLCFAYLEEGDIVEGVRRLGVVVARMLQEAGEVGVVGAAGEVGVKKSGGVDEFK